MLYSDVTLLLQGPYSSNQCQAFDNIEYYKSLFGEIVMSTYTENVTTELVEYCNNHNIKLLHQTMNIPNVPHRVVFFQTYSVLLGLSNISKKYCLKHRIDEKYSNLEKMVDKFLLDDEKRVSGSMYFNPKNREPFCASDHLFIGKTDKLLKTFQLTYRNVINGITEVNSDDGGVSPEITYTKNFIRISSGLEPTLENHDELMKKYFDLVWEGELQPFVIKQNSCSHVYTTEEEFRRWFPKLNGIEDIFKYCDWWDIHK